MKRLILRLIVVGMLVLVTLLIWGQVVYADRVPPLGPDAPATPYPLPVPKLLPPPPAYARSVDGNGIQEAQIITNPVLDMKVLVIHDGPADVSLPTIKAYLDILGIPYITFDVMTTTLLTESALWDGNRGFYYAIVVSTANVTNPWSGRMDPTERSALENFERNFRVRRLTWYADNPYELDYGLVYPATPTTAPLTAFLTNAGKDVFGYLRPDIALPIQDAYALLTYPAEGANVTTLLTDTAGHALLSIFRPGDGRERMALTVNSYYPAIPPSNLHARTLPYGMINWVTRGIFVGERHIYYVPQPDDMLSKGDRWDANQHEYVWDDFRLEPADLDAVVTWLTAMRGLTPTANLKIEMPFNGDGSEMDRYGGGSGLVKPNTLTAKAIALQDQFVWLNHTYSHADLYTVNYAIAHSEVLSNTQTANFLGFTDYSTRTLLTGAYSGITNTQVISAAYDLGVRYLLVNASASGYNNPTPNTGIPHPDKPAMLQIPRLANNMFYAATTPEEQTDLYNWLYCPGYQSAPQTPCYTYAQVIDLITYQSLQELLDFNINPTMFHMNALNAYTVTQILSQTQTLTRTLLGDFTEALFTKFNALYKADIPVLSLRTQEIGAQMWERMAYNTSGVGGQIACGNRITLTTTSAARIPLTGVAYGGDEEVYAGQDISYFAMGADATQVIPGAPSKKPAQITGLTHQISGDDAILTWDPTTLDTDGGALGALVYRVYGSTDPNFIPGPGNLLAQVTAPTYTHSGVTGYSYAVTAIGDNCWKLESDPARFNPTAVVLLTFTGVADNEVVHLAWETAAEIDTLGFNLYRADALSGPRSRINAALIPSQSPGSVFGATYAFTDATVMPEREYFYWLEDVDTNNMATLHGPVSVQVFIDPAAITVRAFGAPSSPLGLVIAGAMAILGVQIVCQRRRKHLSNTMR